MRRYAILGYPLAHTLSPFIHTRLFALSGESGEYGRAEISPEALDAEMPNLKSLDGFNVTIPHKEAVIPWLDRLDPSAERYRAVNVVRCTDGACVGYNTDAFGFRRAIELLGTGAERQSPAAWRGRRGAHDGNGDRVVRRSSDRGRPECRRPQNARIADFLKGTRARGARANLRPGRNRRSLRPALQLYAGRHVSKDR